MHFDASPPPGDAHSRRLADRLFAHLHVEDSWVRELRSLLALGPIVYVLRNRNLLDYLALEYITRRYALPPVEFIDERRPQSLWVGRGSAAASAERLANALAAGNRASALFLKQPPSLGRKRGQDLAEGAAQTAALVQYQRSTDRVVHLVPVAFVWTKRPDTMGGAPLDWLFGPRQWPSTLRAATQALTNHSKVAVRIGHAVNFRTFLAQVDAKGEDALRRRLVFTLLRRLERERRSILGPPNKPPEKVRKEILQSPGFRAQLDKITSNDAERKEALKNADKMLREMQALPDGASYRLLDSLLGRLFQQIYAGLDIDPVGIQRLRELSLKGSLVLLPSHKSYIDFLVASYAFYAKHLPMPLIVAGENLSFFPVSGLARHAGAFFIRRTFKDRLYSAVVDAYVKRVMQEGYAIEVFLEGRRSRAGKLLEPKLGLLSMLVTASREQSTRPVYFVPISIGYERIIETASHQHELSGGEKIREDATGLLGATKVLRHRYGRVNLQFGQCFTVDEIAADLGFQSPLGPKQVRTVVRALGNAVMDEINRVTSATPGALVALALLSHSRPSLSHQELSETCARLLALLVAKEVRLCQVMTDGTGALRDEAIAEAAQMFVEAGMITASASHKGGAQPSKTRSRTPAGTKDALYSVVATKRIELDTSKNMLIHFFVAEALVLTALPAAPDAVVSESQLEDECLALLKLFSHEFRFGRDPAQTARDALDRLVTWGILARVDRRMIALGTGKGGWPAFTWVQLFRSMVRNFLEGYWVGALSLSRFEQNPPPEKDAAKPALSLGRQMLASGELARPEALSRAVFENALLTFQDMGLLRSDKGKLHLTVAEDSVELRGLRDRLASHLSAGDGV